MKKVFRIMVEYYHSILIVLNKWYILGLQPRKWGKLVQAATGENGNKRASIDSTTTATGLAIDTRYVGMFSEIFYYRNMPSLTIFLYINFQFQA